MNWLRAHGRAMQWAFARLIAAPLNTLLSMLGIGILLSLPAGGQWLLEHLAALGQGAAATPQLTIFLQVEAERSAAEEIVARLKNRAEVAKVELIAREDTLARMKRQENLADVIAALPKNPFPDAIVVTPADESPVTLEALAAEARQWRKVEAVQVDSDWARRLYALLRLARIGLGFLAILLGLGLVAITFNTIRLQLLTRQAEVEVSRLLGATDAFIRRPFLWYGALLGLCGGAMAWLIVAAAMLALRLPVAELAQLYGIELRLALPTLPFGAMLMSAAAFLGWLGAALSLRQQWRAP